MEKIRMTQSPQSKPTAGEQGPITPELVAAVFSAFAKGREGMSFARTIAEARSTETTSERRTPCP
jgi:hypothetical protein